MAILFYVHVLMEMGPAIKVTCTQEGRIFRFPLFSFKMVWNIWKVPRNSFQASYKLLQQYPRLRERYAAQFIVNDP